MTIEQKVKRKRKLIEKHKKELSSLLEACTHRETEVVKYHYQATYFNQAVTEYWEQCKLCRVRLKLINAEETDD